MNTRDYSLNKCMHNHRSPWFKSNEQCYFCLIVCFRFTFGGHIFDIRYYLQTLNITLNVIYKYLKSFLRTLDYLDYQLFMNNFRPSKWTSYLLIYSEISRNFVLELSIFLHVTNLCHFMIAVAASIVNIICYYLTK